MSTYEIDKEKLDRIKFQILKAEHENIKTRELSSKKMSELIKKIIIDEVNRNF